MEDKKYKDNITSKSNKNEFKTYFIDFWNKAKKNMMFYSIILIFVFVIIDGSLKLFNMKFMIAVESSIFGLFSIGMLIGILQAILKGKKKTKIIFRILGIALLIIIAVFWQIILIALFFSYTPLHVVEKDGKKYVAVINSFLQVEVNYYDYINPIVMGNKIKIYEDYGNGGYDPLDGTHENLIPQRFYYYDDNGNIIKSNVDENDNNEENLNSNISSNNNNLQNLNNNSNLNNNNKDNDNKDNSNDEKKVLYEKKFNDKVSLRVNKECSILGGKIVISIEKSIDSGITWKNMLNTADGGMEINNNFETSFIDENIGFITDKGIQGTSGDNKKLYVTTDGGKNFIKSNINYPSFIDKDDTYIKDVPYKENNKLQLKIYKINNDNDENEIIYQFISNDNGLNWNYIN